MIVPATASQISDGFDSSKTRHIGTKVELALRPAEHVRCNGDVHCLPREVNVAGCVESPSAETSTRTTRLSARSAVHP